MSEKDKTGKITAGERMMAQVLRWVPWLAFFLVALPMPIYFLTKYSPSTPDTALNFLFALVSLAAGSVVAFIVMLLLLYCRSSWAPRVRDRGAADGATADEVPWFTSELTTSGP